LIVFGLRENRSTAGGKMFDPLYNWLDDMTDAFHVWHGNRWMKKHGRHIASEDERAETEIVLWTLKWNPKTKEYDEDEAYAFPATDVKKIIQIMGL